MTIKPEELHEVTNAAQEQFRAWKKFAGMDCLHWVGEKSLRSAADHAPETRNGRSSSIRCLRINLVQCLVVAVCEHSQALTTVFAENFAETGASLNWGTYMLD